MNWANQRVVVVSVKCGDHGFVVEHEMYRTMKKWMLAVGLASLMQFTIVCDSDEWEDFFDDFGVEVYYDDGCGGYWDCHCYDCDDDDWWDFDWW